MLSVFISVIFLVLQVLSHFKIVRSVGQFHSELIRNQICGIECVNAHNMCLSLDKLCDGNLDCPNGDDEDTALCSGPLMANNAKSRHHIFGNPVSTLEFAQFAHPFKHLDSSS